MAFSEAFQARLRASAKNITPEAFINEFENHFSKPPYSSGGVYHFSLSLDMKQSSTKVECLTALKKNLEACGFKETTNTFPTKGHFAFVCEKFVCQWEKSYESCHMIKCEEIVICI
jgi:hypothetical protein